MNRKWFYLLPVGACLCAAWVVRAAAPSSAESAPNKILPATATGDDLIVHEWGTFTTFSGSDGIRLDFRPLAAAYSDLPDFVRDRAFGFGSPWSKGRIRGKVRMETPVTYFYTERERSIRVKVDFPKGLLTEFYPPVQSFLPAFDRKVGTTTGETIGNSSLDWGTVQLIPASAFRPQVSDPKDAEWLQQQILQNLCLPGNGHYTAARATDSAFVRTVEPLPAKPVIDELDGFSNMPGRRHLEKFLFYRGVGKFELPVTATADASGQVSLINKGDAPLTGAFLVQVRSGADGRPTLWRTRVAKVPVGSPVVFDGPHLVTDRNKFYDEIVSQLVSEGLYEKEARAMVATWEDSWFTEIGTRVFYCLPQAATDEILPLTIEPKPQQTVRVLVARLEVMTKSDETRVLETIGKSAVERTERIKAAGGARIEEAPIPADLLALGRLAEPALARAKSIAREETVRTEAERLLNQLQNELQTR
ncbi:hypothetical protein [Planctomyces sp. SH-PL14]|uniref:hypothetical protein n=1 Tax=Planctomyces sp. SH-PL14 TaxID=1632864 RepID=UPI00078D5B25|nr:hypothetical protein [Planctomyces sp. SH-PL14]AMV17473.1 hypothetical protein VT03_06250 [Planctomyces sp. SH-PL14]